MYTEQTGRKARGEAAAFCSEPLQRCLEQVCFPETSRVVISVGQGLFRSLQIKGTEGWRDGTLLPEVLGILTSRSHTEHGEILEKS